jgi:hypothetical protein
MSFPSSFLPARCDRKILESKNCLLFNDEPPGRVLVRRILVPGGELPVRVRTDIFHRRRSQAAGELLGVSEAMELLSGLKRQKGQKARPGKDFRD